MTDHHAVREALELAAAEPDGIERLVAGDTPEAAAVAGHLAGCTECTDEFGRLRRIANLVREGVTLQPSPELRERTLAFVAEVGRARPVAPVAPPSEVVAQQPERRISGAAWGLAAAAILVFAIGLTWTIAGLVRDDTITHQSREIAALGQLTAWQLRIDARPDAERVLLAGAGDDAPLGSLAFSPASQEIVVTVTGLEEPHSGNEYRCWVTVDGERKRMGKMYFTADVAFWVGRVPILDEVEQGATFGVSLVDRTGANLPPDPVLSGTL
jgi:hypothetical protein